METTKQLAGIKWTATVTLIIGFGLASYGVYPLGPMVQLLGGLIWLVAALAMRDRPLIVTNGVMTVVGAAGLAANLL